MKISPILPLPLLILLFGLTSGEIYFRKGSPHVSIPSKGLLSGTLSYSRDGRPFTSFLGLRYGSIPSRFSEAIEAPAWEGTWNGSTYGNKCDQSGFLGQSSNIGNEDCLFLNVHVPLNNTQEERGYPIMLWIHGGGFTAGSGDEYGPNYFLDEDVILITINYRLGLFGFLSTGDEVIPGNNGLKDLVLGLKWIQKFAKYFGGDPSRVTIFGESAGAALVHYLVLSDETDGLISGAISQSASALNPWAYDPTPREIAVKFATYLKCPSEEDEPTKITSEEIFNCLKDREADELIKAQKVFEELWPAGGDAIPFRPVKEPKSRSMSRSLKSSPFLTESPWKILKNDLQKKKMVPWMVGVTPDEGVIFAVMNIKEEILPELDRRWNEVILHQIGYVDSLLTCDEDKVEVAEKIRQFYLGKERLSKKSWKQFYDMYGDSWINYGVRKAAMEQAKNEDKVYLYYYDHEGQISIMKLLGLKVPEGFERKITHADDLIPQFNLDNWLPHAKDVVKFDDDEKLKFSKDFVKLWVSFAKDGQPTHSWEESSDKKWMPLSKTEGQGQSSLKWYKISSQSSSYINDEEKWKESNSFWENLYQKYIFKNVM